MLRTAASAPTGLAAARRAPVEVTRRPSSRSSTVTEPSSSVRNTRAPVSRSRARVDRAGCPYVLPAPALATATRGRSTSSSGCVVAVALPWWATLSTSSRGRPRASSSGSTPSSTSPVSRNRRPFASPRSTIDTLLIPVPLSGGSSGTVPGSGQSTDRATSPSRIAAPVARIPRGGPSWSLASQAAQPGPGPRIPGSYTRRTAYRSRIRASPATWSSCGCVRTTTSSRRSHGGIRSSRATSTRSGSGPPSTSIRAPVRVSSRIASPCPTSRTVSRVVRPAASPNAAAEIATTIAAATSAPRSTGERGPRTGRRFDRVIGGCVDGRLGLRSCRARRINVGTRNSASAAATPAAWAIPGGSATAANGTAAPMRTNATITWSTSQPGSPASVARIAGAPSDAATPPARASTPPAIATGTSGTTARLTAGATIDRRPKVARTSGSVAACAASEMPRLSASHRGIRPPPTRPRRCASGFAHASSPAVARTDSRNPASPIMAGSASSRIAAAAPSAAAARPARPDSRRQQDDPGHDRRPDDGRRRARRDDVGAHGEEDRDRHETAGAAPHDRPDEPRDDRDVPARDRHHVAHPCRREVRGQVPVDALPEADEDPGREACLGLRERPAQPVARPVAERLQRHRWRNHEAEHTGVEGPGRAGPPQVLAVRVIVGRGSEAPVDSHDRARRDDGVGGERRPHRDLTGAGLERQRGDLLPVPW